MQIPNNKKAKESRLWFTKIIKIAYKLSLLKTQKLLEKSKEKPLLEISYKDKYMKLKKDKNITINKLTEQNKEYNKIIEQNSIFKKENSELKDENIKLKDKNNKLNINKKSNINTTSNKENIKLTYAKIAKSELRMFERRCGRVSKLFFTYKKLQTRKFCDAISINLRKTKFSKKIKLMY
jgi:hypothetical protein